MLKRYYAQFSLQKLGYNFYVFYKVDIYNDEYQINEMLSAKIKE